jgi:hypothetical protein
MAFQWGFGIFELVLFDARFFAAFEPDFFFPELAFFELERFAAVFFLAAMDSPRIGLR